MWREVGGGGGVVVMEDVGRRKCGENTRHTEMGLKNIFRDYCTLPKVFIFVPRACTLKSAHQTA